MKMTEEEITRIVTPMLSKTETTAKTNLISFGYQPKDEPTYIAFYFRSFDGKEHFLDFINQYNEIVKKNGEDDNEIKDICLYIEKQGRIIDNSMTNKYKEFIENVLKKISTEKIISN